MKIEDEDDEYLERKSCILNALPLCIRLSEIETTYGCIFVSQLNPFLNTNHPFKAEIDLAFFSYILQLTSHSSM